MIENAKESPEFSLFHRRRWVRSVLTMSQTSIFRCNAGAHMDHVNLFELREGKEPFGLLAIIIDEACNILLNWPV